MSGLFEAYLAGSARELYAGHFGERADRRRAVTSAVRALAPAVAAALESQNSGYATSAARDQHLAALRRGAAAVVTGQQVGLFLGPLYTLYKAASAVAVARTLAAETGERVVPVFWLQTEDHDLPEIAACNLPRPGGGARCLRVPASPSERTSIAHCALPEEVSTCLADLRREIGHLPHAAAHLARLERHYRPGAGWGDAFAGVLAELFADQGLVLVDPRDPALGGAAAAVHRRALEQAGAIARSLQVRADVLVAAGFAPTVHVRPGAPLSFFHPADRAGPRYRLAPQPDGFVEVGGDGHHSAESLLDALARDPLRFSTSALLRPILQDTLLPTAAYVGGPAEVAYFAQLAPLYEAFGLTTPLVVPRARFVIVGARTAHTLERLGLEARDAEQSEDALLAASSDADPLERETLADALLAPFDAALGELRARIEATGAGLGTAIDKTRAAVEAATFRLAAKVEKARLHRDQERLAEIRRLKLMLHPDGMPQERYYGMSYFAARHGERELVEGVLAAIEPFDPTPKVLTLDSPLSCTESAR